MCRDAEKNFMLKKHLASAWLFKSFKFENESRMSHRNLAILDFKYLQNKKWYWKQAAKMSE